MRTPTKFELHYYLNDTSHSIDALLHNKCEAEFLAVAYEIINELGFNISLEAEALHEGGLRDWFRYVVNEASLTDKIQIVIAATLILQLVFSRFPVETDLQRTIQEQNFEKSNLEIQLLKHEIEKLNQIQSIDISPTLGEAIEPILRKVEKNKKIITRRSNFYRKLSLSPKIQSVSFSGLDAQAHPVLLEKKILKRDFNRFIVRNNKLSIETIDNAEITIVAPVLENNRSKWKGIYEDQIISFEMLDQEFKDAILTKQISFTRGQAIICVLNIHREINELGEVEIKRYTVEVVIDKIENGTFVTTKSGRQHLRDKEQAKGQGNLFD